MIDDGFNNVNIKYNSNQSLLSIIKIDKNEEIERETYIKNKLQCTFIRFNPSVKFFNIGMIISQIFKHIREYKNI